jgi:tryptophan-rich sensory protein
MSLLPPGLLPFWMDPDGGAFPPERQGQALGLFAGICGVAAFYASLYAPSESGSFGWYPRLAKPAWAPAPAFTGPVSTLFFAVLAVSIWRVWRTGAFRTVPVTAAGFACLLFLQSLWSTLFYGLQSPLLGLLDLVAAVIVAGVLWLIYQPLDWLASRLWLAYLLWICFLVPINAAIWWLNR